MRHILFTIAIATLVASSSNNCRADEKAQAVINKAIAAMGGEKKLAQHRAFRSKETGTYYGMGEGLPYTGIYAVQWPGQFSVEIKGIFTMVLNNDKGWFSTMGNTVEMPADQLQKQKADHFAGWTTTLLPLKDPKFKLSHMGQFEVDGKPAVGVKVSHKDKHINDLFFDAESGLLVKSFNRTLSDEQGKEVDQEIFYSKYKEIDGAKVAMKVVIMQDGNKFVEGETTEYHPVDKLDDSVFGKP